MPVWYNPVQCDTEFWRFKDKRNISELLNAIAAVDVIS